MKVEYRSNNSGGGWWLKDEDWYALEKAGWKVDWKKGRWLGALATSASREGLNLQEAVEEFERITGQDATEEGCNCCGEPHYFTLEDDEGKYLDSLSNHIVRRSDRRW